MPSEKRVEKMRVQLERWSAIVDRLGIQTDNARTVVTLAEHQRLDELRALRVIAQARFGEFQSSKAPADDGTASTLAQAWTDLASAMRKLKSWEASVRPSG